MTTDIVAAYLSKNHLAPADVPGLVMTVHAALAGLATGIPPSVSSSGLEPLTPAEIRKSITPDALISFLDGRSYKTLGRHLLAYGLTPDNYRRKFGLPADYPMVSPNYSVRRSELAKAHRFGRTGAQAVK